MTDRADPGPEAEPAPDGPTELVTDERGQIVERLSGGTATLLLVWLIGIGALSGLLAAWLAAWLLFGQRLGADELIGGLGFYVALAGGSGPCVLWLAGRAQGHSLAWFGVTAVKIALAMAGTIAFFAVVAGLMLAGQLPGLPSLGGVAIAIGIGLGLTVIWALATWAADRWIARARVPGHG